MSTSTQYSLFSDADLLEPEHCLADLIDAATAARLPRSLHALKRMSDESLKQCGCSRAEISRIRCMFSAAALLVAEPEPQADSPDSCLSIVLPYVRDLLYSSQEHFIVACFNSKKHLIGVPQLISLGTLRNCLVDQCTVFRVALLASACSIVTLHNHPSGDVTPSAADLCAFERLDRAGEIVGIQPLDHFIIGLQGAFSWSHYNMHGAGKL